MQGKGKTEPQGNPQKWSSLWIVLGTVLVIIVGVYTAGTSKLLPIQYQVEADPQATSTPTKPKLDTLGYDLRLLALAHVATSSLWYEYFLTGTNTPRLVVVSTTTATSTNSGQASSTVATTTMLVTPKVTKQPWPVKTVYPEYGALLPFKRIVAYYGNYYSKQMGVLGEYPEDEVLAKLASTTAIWEAADPKTPVIPAIDYIAVTAQAAAGQDGLYRARMPDSQIDKALEMAAKINGLVILDVQVGKSTLQEELPALEPYLKLPNVELAIDPEFSMKGTAPPGRIIGTYNAEDINYAIDFLSQLVKEGELPPKVLIIHRFTWDMVTEYENIKPTPQVQVVMDMDGWGYPEKKVVTYNAIVAAEPVQFTGFKIFYHNDLRPPSTRLITPEEVLNLTPAPIFIQYQ